MLPAPARLRRQLDFAVTLRSGRRTGRPSLVLYVRPTGAPGRAGLIVSKAVGGAVVRNRVKRRLRHLVAPRLAGLAADVVLRALPASAGDPGSLDRDLASAWEWARRAAAAEASLKAGPGAP
ncbi:MAG: ribonuclease P protein component [Propionibacteriaceae bacterium]|jgi:ribonuclease P protein component|nr:ribonuclease P protein component [Propionibacteriaceae bacterium]